MNRHLIIGIPLLCLFLAAFSHEGKGQTELKFEDQLKAAPTASDSLPVIFNLIEAYRSTEPTKSIELAYLARNISSRLDDRQAYARSYTLLGHGYYEIGHYEKALENYSNALNRCI